MGYTSYFWNIRQAEVQWLWHKEEVNKVGGSFFSRFFFAFGANYLANLPKLSQNHPSTEQVVAMSNA